MKKVLRFFLILCVCLFLLASCSEVTSSPSGGGANEDIHVTEEESSTDSKPANSHPKFDPKNSKSNSFGLTLGELMHIWDAAALFEDFITYETPQYTVHRTGSGTNGALFFSRSGSDKIEVAFFLSYSGASRSSDSTKSAMYAQELLCSYCDSNGIAYTAEEVEQEPYLVFSVCALDSSLDNLPLSIRHLRSKKEFFADNERVATFCNLLLSCNYQELKTYLDQFISANQCPNYDIVYELSAKTDEIITLMDGCYVEVDNVEKNAKIFYNGVTEISKKINVVPHIKTSEYGASFNIDFGFIRSNWIFFDEIYYASNSTETEKYRFSKTATDIIGGGTIIEVVSAGTSAQNAFINICGTDGAVIRFMNSDTEEYVDHEITEAEANSCLRLRQILDLHDEIWDSLSEWENA